MNCSTTFLSGNVLLVYLGRFFFDEIDHLGGYIERNRIDITASEFSEQGYTLTNFVGMSGIVDNFFSGDGWKTNPPPSQHYPERLQQILRCLEKDKRPGWLAGNAHLRDFSSDFREQLEGYLEQLTRSLIKYPSRSFTLAGKDDLPTLLISVQRLGAAIPTRDIDELAAATSIALNASKVAILTVEVAADLLFAHASYRIVPAPNMLVTNYSELAAKAEAMKSRFISLNTPKPNEPCHCGSGKRYKRCHGRK